VLLCGSPPKDGEVEKTSRARRKEQQDKDKNDDDDADDDDVGDPKVTLGRNKKKGAGERVEREEGSERAIAERRVSSFVCTALEREGTKGMKAEGKRIRGDRWPFQTMRNSGDKGVTQNARGENGRKQRRERMRAAERL